MAIKKICIVSPQKRNKMSSLHWHYMGVISASLKALFFFLNLFPGWTKSSSVMPTLSASGRNTGHNASRKNNALCNTKHNTLWCSRLLWVEVGWWFLKVWLTRVCSDLQAGIREKAHTVINYAYRKLRQMSMVYRFKAWQTVQRDS